MKTWFSIQAKAAGNAEIVIYDEVGLYGVTAKTFYDQLRALGDVGQILVRINSAGGDVFDGIAIYNMLKNHKARVDVVVDGIAASIASIIAMAGDKVTMPANTFMFVHDPLALVIGDAENMREMADSLDKIAASLINTYTSKTGKSEAEVKKWMSEDTWFTAQEALDAGLADEVITAVDIAARFDLSRFRNAPAALQLPPVPPPLPVDANAIRAQATEVETQRAVAVASACAGAGRPELAGELIAQGLTADEARAFIADPEKLKTLQTVAVADELKEIYTLCNKAGVADLADKFIAEGRSVEWTRERLKHADAIRARCAAAAKMLSHIPSIQSRADGFIRAGATAEEVGHSLLELLVSLQGPEIDNSLSPDSAQGVSNTVGRPSAPTQLISAAEIYAKRNRRPDDAADRLLAALRPAIR